MVDGAWSGGVWGWFRCVFGVHRVVHTVVHTVVGSGTYGAFMSSHTGTTHGVRTKGVVRIVDLSALDVQILQFLVRFTFARGYQVAGWTGASPAYVRNRLTLLADGGFVTRYVQSVDLLGDDGTVRRGTATVWEATTKGTDAAGEWEVPGTGGVRTSLAAPKLSPLMANHVLGVADLACWYRQFGFQVAAEREILSLEKDTKLAPGRAVISAWTVPVVGRPGVHPPDLGAVGADGRMWAVELERAVKTVQEYTDVIRAYQAVGMGQVWHVLGQATARRLQEACLRAGVTWGTSPQPGVLVSADGAVRLQGWLPGRARLRLNQWRAQFPITPPAGLPVKGRPDLSVTWRAGNRIDIDSEVRA